MPCDFWVTKFNFPLAFALPLHLRLPSYVKKVNRHAALAAAWRSLFSVCWFQHYFTTPAKPPPPDFVTQKTTKT